MEVELAVYQQRCLDNLIWAIKELEGQVESDQLERIAELIIATMAGPWRYFHTPEHIFEVGESGDAVEVLAALFHDLVYVQVDQGVSINISRHIAPFIKEVRGELVILSEDELPKDQMFELAAAIFGFAPNQALSPFAGQNEFLSAVIAAKSLEPFLKPSAIAEILTCIEATIPFRSKSSTGLTCSEILYQRLVAANHQFNLGLKDAEIVESVKRAVRLSNRDVENFSTEHSAHFLDNTWNLLPETNHQLINPNSYTVRGYRTSLQKMEGFISFLKPEVVFNQFQGYPDDESFAELIARTKKNLEVAKLYLGIKLTTIALLEALSCRIGLDIPISTMMGELPAYGQKVAGLEHYLPSVDSSFKAENSIENEVFELLDKGRSQESAYDLKNSPLATFIIQSVGFEQSQSLLVRAKEFFKGDIEAEDFLKDCHPDIVAALTESVAQLFDTRKAALHGVY
ncbi:hypothetical protein Cri9333_3602 [Crinalium epipsammum PCC 9333]|uniref:Uncharacterized protein n=1 Tax=Crinalium epipsammum PCC 9333 TaxID=1173022 RepID=K9W3Q2_9CYAN|nr:hypothetical protein [Crinalium epipsammum]AFZ14424.1 hypothetical protein Cri9333_3602 [Crinalium epipsammum PCC 9333]